LLLTRTTGLWEDCPQSRKSAAIVLPQIIGSKKKKGRMKIPQIRVETQTSIKIRGLKAAAAHCGCSPSHLRRVITGQRIAGEALRKKLDRVGIQVGCPAR
jgi:hypothetical protein